MATFRLKDGVDFPGPARIGTAAGEVVLDEGEREFEVDDSNGQLVSDLSSDTRIERVDEVDTATDADDGLTAYERERLAKNELLRDANEVSGGIFPIAEDVKDDSNVDATVPAPSQPAAEGSIDDPNVPNADDPNPFVAEPDPVVAGGENF